MEKIPRLLPDIVAKGYYTMTGIGIRLSDHCIAYPDIMCFSATASFGAATALAGIGVVSVRKAGTPSNVPFALVPVLFALQQVSEGILWISLSYDDLMKWKEPATYFFLFFAQFLWTWWIPWSIYKMERDKRRKALLYITFFLGLCCSAMLGYRLYLYGVYAGIGHHHIRYDIGTTRPLMVASSVLYVISIIVPFFISSVVRIRVPGVLLVISILGTRFFYKEYFISVWCFFAALLSISVIYVLVAARRKEAQGQYSSPRTHHESGR